jgi:hypothetical protein
MRRASPARSAWMCASRRRSRPRLLHAALGGGEPTTEMSLQGDFNRGLAPRFFFGGASEDDLSASIGTDGKIASRPVSRVLSARFPPRDGHSSGTRLAARLMQPTRAAGLKTGWRNRFRRAAPIWSCSRRGLPCRPCRQGRGALLPHPFTLTCHRRWTDPGRRSALCGAVPGVAPAGPYPAPCFRGARTFLPAQGGAAVRPAGFRYVGAASRFVAA